MHGDPDEPEHGVHHRVLAAAGDQFLDLREEGAGVRRLGERLVRLQVVDGLHVSGGEKLTILPFTGEISYRCFKERQKYF